MLASAITPEAPRIRVPALIVVPPVYVFTPDSVSVLVPLFVTPPAPLNIHPSTILPEAVLKVRVADRLMLRLIF